MPRRIAFISTYSHPSRDSVERTLRAAFPEYELDVIAVSDIAKRHRQWVVPNLAYCAKESGRELLACRTDLRTAYFRTSYFLRRLHAAMREYVSPSRHVFSFQTQSMYDTSVPGVPHFLYTDHTHLSNLNSAFFDRRSLRPKAWLELERGIYHNATRVFTRSSDVTADLLRYYDLPAEQVECVYSGSNIHVPEDFRTDNADFSNRNVLFVGGDWERKGGPVLVEAFRQVQKTFPDARLTIAGASPAVDLPNCRVLGHVPLRELTPHYAQASIFCVPTLLEPFGIVYLEAMLHGLPVIATRTGALPDMVTDFGTGRLVEPGDVSGLAAALIDLLGDPRRCQAYGRAGLERARSLYSWEHVGRRWRAAILPLINP
jgi:glycosyltransferase involved in cell wall biosynthesis